MNKTPTISITKSRIAFRQCLVIASWMCLLVSATGCRSYHLGNQYLFRSDIRSVHVAMAESDSFRRFEGQRLTEAVVKQISNSTPLTITEPALADSVIRTRLIRDQKSVLTETFTDEVRALQTNWVVEVEWTDRAGTPLMNRQRLTISHDGTFIPEGGQSISTAQQEAIERIAREIVGQMEMPW